MIRFRLGVRILKKENVSDAVIRRLPRYYRQLTELCAKGVVRISSHSLGQEMNITASQIRQDLSCFGEFGQQGYGYNVEELHTEIGHILGVDNDHHLVMIDSQVRFRINRRKLMLCGGSFIMLRFCGHT